MPIEVGTCSGQNLKLTGVEYHQGSETIIAITDCILILGRLQDVDKYTYDTSLMEYFYIHEGECLELYSTTLHYAPCQIDQTGFAIICILVRDTNKECLPSCNPTLFKYNKFVINYPSQIDSFGVNAVPRLQGTIPQILLP